VHLTGPGTCTITASQVGNGNYSAAADVPRTFAINSASVSQLTANSACSAFSGGTAQTLGLVEYTAKSGTINRATPTGFYYWVKVTAPAGPNSFTVAQSITTGNFSTQFALTSGSNVYNSACAKKPRSTITAGASGVTATFTAPSAGTYYIGIHYTTSSVNRKPVPSPTTVHYEFSTGGVAGSTSGLDLKQPVPASPASSARAAMFGAIRR
jgi:trimeric autotransporter adhesin